MPTTEVDVANDALYLLGQESITALSDTTDRAKLMNQFFARSRQAVLRDHPWNFAIARVASKAYTEPAFTLTPGAGATTKDTTGVTFTASGAAFTSAAVDVGRVLKGDGVVGKATITGFTSTTVVTATITEAWTGSVVVSGSWRLYEIPPVHTYKYTHSKPANWVRWLDTEFDDTTTFRVEGAYLVSDDDAIDLTYVVDVTDPSKWDALFVEAFAAHLALKTARPITGKGEVVAEMGRLYGAKLSQAKAADGMEGTPYALQANTLIDVRL